MNSAANVFDVQAIFTAAQEINQNKNIHMPFCYSVEYKNCKRAVEGDYISNLHFKGGQGMNILALDDEEIALEGLVSAEKKAEPSAAIYSFRKPKEVLELCKSTPCEVALLDIQMRNMSGVELAKELKFLNPGVNIIFTTGYVHDCIRLQQAESKRKICKGCGTCHDFSSCV